MRKSTMRYFFILLSLVGLVAAGCGDDSSSNAARTTASPKATGDITVLAAASLTESFKEIGTAFEAANPGAKVTFSFAASSALATQINQGAPTDVFASADTTNMDKITA